LIGDASRGDQSLFAGEDLVEAAWRVVDGVLDGPAATLRTYEPGTWGPPEAEGVLDRGDRWHDPAGKLPVGKLQVPATDAPGD
jgi:glucose-6-phosphate 1-dehydrogenase